MRKACGVVALVAGLMACDDHDHGHEGEATGALCPDGNTLSYQSFGEAFMADYCVDCHSSTATGSARKRAPVGIDFDTIEGIRLHAAHIDEHAAAGPNAVNEGMPEDDPKPTLEERTKLGQWLACGAP